MTNYVQTFAGANGQTYAEAMAEIDARITDATVKLTKALGVDLEEFRLGNDAPFDNGGLYAGKKSFPLKHGRTLAIDATNKDTHFVMASILDENQNLIAAFSAGENMGDLTISLHQGQDYGVFDNNTIEAAVLDQTEIGDLDTRLDAFLNGVYYYEDKHGPLLRAPIKANIASALEMPIALSDIHRAGSAPLRAEKSAEIILRTLGTNYSIDPENTTPAVVLSDENTSGTALLLLEQADGAYIFRAGPDNWAQVEMGLRTDYSSQISRTDSGMIVVGPKRTASAIVVDHTIKNSRVEYPPADRAAQWSTASIFLRALQEKPYVGAEIKARIQSTLEPSGNQAQVAHDGGSDGRSIWNRLPDGLSPIDPR